MTKETKRKPVIYIVDDDDGMRRALTVLMTTVGYQPVAFARPAEFLAQYDANQAGCLVLDVRMPEMSGLEVQQQLNRNGALLPVILMTGHGDIPMAVQAIKEGAFDFLEKPCDDQTLLDKVAHALTVAEGVMRQRKVEASVQERMSTLTQCEVEVAQKLREGRNNKEIAREIDVNVRTVEHYRANVFAKMGVRNAVELSQLLFDRDGRR